MILVVRRRLSSSVAAFCPEAETEQEMPCSRCSPVPGVFFPNEERPREHQFPDSSPSPETCVPIDKEPPLVGGRGLLGGAGEDGFRVCPSSAIPATLSTLWLQRRSVSLAVALPHRPWYGDRVRPVADSARREPERCPDGRYVLQSPGSAPKEKHDFSRYPAVEPQDALSNCRLLPFDPRSRQFVQQQPCHPDIFLKPPMVALACSFVPFNATRPNTQQPRSVSRDRHLGEDIRRPRQIGSAGTGMWSGSRASPIPPATTTPYLSATGPRSSGWFGCRGATKAVLLK